MMKKKLEQDYVLLQKQLAWLEISLNECQVIGIKKEYTVEV